MSPAAASASTGSGCSLVVNAGNSPQDLRLDLELPAPSVGGIWLFAPRVNGSRPRCPQQRLAPPTARAARWLSPGLLEKGNFDMARLLQVNFNSQPVAVHCLRWIACSLSTMSTLLASPALVSGIHPSKQTQRAPPWEISPPVSTMVSDLAK
ncbi:hypothetical protein B0H11DRAFT_1905124 [Mycena galericulata]|nr:hypothetical protein B0H11DRAFT_1905124 [Mycena galericulata]